MPLHLASALSSSSSSPSSKPATHRRLPPLNIMRGLSLCRKSRPTCTLSLAHVSACKTPPPEDAKQVDTLQLDLSTIHFVAVPIPHVPTSPKRRTKTNNSTKMTTTTVHNEINVIPFPTSTQTAVSTTTTTTTSPPSPISHTPNSFKRSQLQKKEDLDRPSSPLSSSVSPPRKRARKGTVTTTATATTPSSSSRGTPSPRARALAQRVPPPRPSTPTPDSQDDDMDVGDKSPVQPSSTDLVQDDAPANHQPTSQGGQEAKPDLEKHGHHTELPPYSVDPPPYSPPVVVVAPIPISSPTPIPLHAPIPALLSNSSPPISSSATSSAPLPPTSPPRSPPPAPPPSPSSSPPPQQRRPRIPPSELRFFIFLYRTLISGLETRQRGRSNTQVRRSRDGSRREQHLDGVLVEMDDDDDDDDVDMKMDDDDAKDSSDSLNEDLEVQDALLALRLRGFLKWNGVDEWMLKVDSSPPSSPTTTTTTTGVMNPFLQDGTTMDVDIHQQQQQAPPPPILSSQHLITVLRMRGTCGPRQGGPIGLGMKNKREGSKLRICLFNDDDGDEDC